MTQPNNPSRRQFFRASGTAFLTGFTASSFSKTIAHQPVEVPNVDEHIRKQVEEAPLAMKFRGTSAEECRQWQKDFAAKLRFLLGPHMPPAQWKTTVERSTELDDHRRDELVLTADGHPPLPVYLLTPLKKAEQRRAGIVALHGHGAFGYDTVAGRDDGAGITDEIKSLKYDYGRQLARRGHVVAVPCLMPFGRRLGAQKAAAKKDACADTFIRLQLLGKLLIAENLRDALWSLELLARHEQVDAKKLGCVGLSYGGRMTMLTAALEPRIRVAVVSGALNVMQERIAQPFACGAQIIPGLLNFGDVPEIGSLIAPRPCVWEVGSRDKLISPRWADEALTRMRRAYKALVAQDQLLVDRFDGGHEWSGRIGYPLLEKVLG